MTATDQLTSHHNSTMINPNSNMAPRKPKDKFSVHDQINVTSKKSKHFGRNGTITSLGLRRITVEFDDNLPGKYVDYSHATRIAADLTSGEETTHKTTGEVDEISRLLEHLAFTAAATISSTGKGSERSVNLTAHFNRCLRAQLEVFGQVTDVRASTDGE
jgi:hypothetical protein